MAEGPVALLSYYGSFWESLGKCALAFLLWLSNTKLGNIAFSVWFKL